MRKSLHLDYAVLWQRLGQLAENEIDLQAMLADLASEHRVSCTRVTAALLALQANRAEQAAIERELLL